MTSNPRPVALVTGASSGIGRALSVRLAEDGYDVGLCARRAGLLEEVAQAVRSAGGRASVHPHDVSSRDAVLHAVAECEQRLGAVDLLIANAGIGGRRGVEVDGENVERVFGVNVLGAVYAVEAVLPAMLQRGSGHLVCVSSIAAYGGLPRAGAYSASKAALTTYFESKRLDLRGTGVDVTVLAPGWVRTPMTGGEHSTRPILLELEPAVDRMMRAIRERRPHLAFPWTLATAVRLGRLLPRFAYDRLVGGLFRRHPSEDGEAPPDGRSG